MFISVCTFTNPTCFNFYKKKIAGFTEVKTSKIPGGH